jgi:phosphoribosylamine--glycine ligase
MGSCSPSPVLSAAEQRQVLEEVLLPTVREMRARGCDYRGLLYAGLMLVPGRGPLVLEFNCRLGDPETQPVLARWRGDLLPWLVGAARGCLPEGEPAFDPRVAVCVVLASRGYPGPYAQGHAIHGLAEAETLPGVAVFHAGTRWEGERCLTAGGRVLGVTAVDDDLVGARARAYEAVSRIQFVDMHYRRDIGQRGMQGERR